MSRSEMGEAALELSRMRLAVFPLKPNKKEPATKHGCKDAALIGAEDAEQWGNHNIGIATGSINGIIVIDIDMDEDSGKDGFRWLRKWELEHGPLPETWSVCTPRGGMHYYFAYNGSDIRNSTDEDKAIDIRGEGGYVVAPPSRTRVGGYEWEVAPQDVPIAPVDIHVMDFIRSVSGANGNSEKFELPTVVTSGARNDTLFKLASSLQAKGMEDSLILDALRGANSSRCKPPLSEQDVLKIWNSVVNRYEKGRSDAPESSERGEAAPKVDVSIIDGIPAIWDGSRYQVGVRAIDRALIKAAPKVSRTKRRDMREDALLLAEEVHAADARYVAFNNGVVDITDIEARLQPYSRDMHIINVIPHDFNVGAKSEIVDRFLDDISCGNPEIRQSLEEVIGLCLHRSCEYARCPILLGRGANGKSTYIRALRNLLGEENTTSLDLNILGAHFQGVNLMGKLANIGDDIANERIQGAIAANWKKMVTGERIYSDIKGSAGVEFTPYATLIFSANEMPSLADSTDGMMRRLMPIPFDADFTGKARDPHMARKLCSEEAAQYLALLGLMALFKMAQRGGIRETEAMREAIASIKADNNTVIQWIDDTGTQPDDIEGRATNDVYADYSAWCQRSGVSAFGKTKFSRQILTLWGFKSVISWSPAWQKAVRVYKFGGEILTDKP